MKKLADAMAEIGRAFIELVELYWLTLVLIGIPIVLVLSIIASLQRIIQSW